MAGAVAGWERVMSAIGAAVDAWRTYGTPAEAAQTTAMATRGKRFALLQSLYAGVGYKGAAGDDYRTAHELYGETRQVVNPVKALCDFYAVHVYSGPLSPDGEREVEGEDAALPLVTLVQGGKTAETALRQAFGQLSQGWWGWDTMLAHRVRQTAILGSLLTEIVDEPASGKLRLETVWPGFVREIDIDAAGNVKAYTLEYTVQEPGPLDLKTGRRGSTVTYRFRKVVNAQGFWQYRDDELTSFASNPYTFVPAVWDRCRLGWGPWGEPIIHGSQGAIDEINELWSHADDRLHQTFATPLVISGAAGAEKLVFDASGRSTVNAMTVPNAGAISTIAFDLGDVGGAIDRIMNAVSLECPELRVYDRIREMSNVTGPGIRRAVADVEHRLNEQASLADRQTIKLLQMGTAVAGWRANNGDWGPRDQLTEEQKKFLPYNLDSFKAGKLDAMLLPRLLVRESVSERIDTLVKIATLSDPWLLEQAGVPQTEIDRMEKEKEAEKADMAAQFGVATGGASSPAGTGGGQEPTASPDAPAGNAPAGNAPAATGG